MVFSSYYPKDQTVEKYVDTTRLVRLYTPTQNFNFRLGEIRDLSAVNEQKNDQQYCKRKFVLSLLVRVSRANFSMENCKRSMLITSARTTNPLCVPETGNGILSFNKITELASFCLIKWLKNNKTAVSKLIEDWQEEIKRKFDYCCLNTTQKQSKFFSIHVINI